MANKSGRFVCIYQENRGPYDVGGNELPLRTLLEGSVCRILLLCPCVESLSMIHQHDCRKVSMIRGCWKVSMMHGCWKVSDTVIRDCSKSCGLKSTSYSSQYSH